MKACEIFGDNDKKDEMESHFKILHGCDNKYAQQSQQEMKHLLTCQVDVHLQIAAIEEMGAIECLVIKKNESIEMELQRTIRESLSEKKEEGGESSEENCIMKSLLQFSPPQLASESDIAAIKRQVAIKMLFSPDDN